MSLSIVGLFHSLTQQFDGKYGDVGNSARALAQWSITFPFIATASCDRKVTGSSAVKDFYAHFNPKYDVYQPSHRSDWLTARRVATVLSKRVVFDAYVAFATEVNQAIEAAEGPEELDWLKIVQYTVLDPMPTYCYAGVQEWITEGIRIAYAKYIIAHWHRRTAWKFLKGSIQSSLRKYSRDGLLGIGNVCWTEARGNSVYIAASTTWRLLKHPWTHRHVYMQPDLDNWEKLSYFCRSSTCEVACMAVRIAFTGIGCGLGVGMGHKMWLSFGGKSSADRWEADGGKEKSIPMAIFLFWSLGYTVSDAILQALLRPHLEVCLGLAPPFDKNEEDDEKDDEPELDID